MPVKSFPLKKFNVMQTTKINSKLCVSQQNNTDELEMLRFTTKSGRWNETALIHYKEKAKQCFTTKNKNLFEMLCCTTILNAPIRRQNFSCWKQWMPLKAGTCPLQQLPILRLHTRNMKWNWSLIWWYVTGPISSLQKQASPLFKLYSPVKVQIHPNNWILNGR